MPRKLRIAGGRRFGCTACGACCKEPGLVFFEAGERAAAAAHLGLEPDGFDAAFDARPAGDLPDMWVVEAVDARGCPLLGPDDRCRVHPVKPAQCRTFPFWPELLEDARAWEDTKRYCPGLDAPEGRLYALEEIRALSAGRGTT